MIWKTPEIFRQDSKGWDSRPKRHPAPVTCCRLGPPEVVTLQGYLTSPLILAWHCRQFICLRIALLEFSLKTYHLHLDWRRKVIFRAQVKQVKVDPTDRTTGVDKDPGTGCWGDLLAHQLLAPVLVLYKCSTSSNAIGTGSLQSHYLSQGHKRGFL